MIHGINLVQELIEEVHRTSLRPLQSILLFLVILITLRGEPMHQPWKIHILIRHAQRRNYLVTVLL